jgi:hypothetical protein
VRVLGGPGVGSESPEIDALDVRITAKQHGLHQVRQCAQLEEAVGNRLDQVAGGCTVAQRELLLGQPDPDIVSGHADAVRECPANRLFAHLPTLFDQAARRETANEYPREGGFEVLLAQGSC